MSCAKSWESFFREISLGSPLIIPLIRLELENWLETPPNPIELALTPIPIPTPNPPSTGFPPPIAIPPLKFFRGTLDLSVFLAAFSFSC